MQLNGITPNFVSFGNQYAEYNKEDKRREHVGDAAKATGAAGAGYAATRGASFKMFQSSQKLNRFVNGVAEGANTINQPIKQSNSLWKALKLNYKNLTRDIAQWAENSKTLPRFIKPLFTGMLGKFIGGAAAVFVFISGVGEVVDTFANNVSKTASKPQYMN